MRTYRCIATYMMIFVCFGGAPQASAGDIVALAGVDCESGVTFTDGKAKVTPGGLTGPKISYTSHHKGHNV